MPKLPFLYAYAAHICHEFMHNVGFCHHSNDTDDVAVAVGEIAYFNIKKWYLKKNFNDACYTFNDFGRLNEIYELRAFALDNSDMKGFLAAYRLTSLSFSII